MLNKKFLLGAVFSTAIFLTACSRGDSAVTETSVEITPETMSESVSETTTDITETKSEAETEDTRIIDPIAAVEKYLRELAESENVTAVELRETRIGQSNMIVDKYYDDPHAEELGITFENDLRDLTAVNVDYSIEYAENSSLESGEKSDYFIVKSDENGFYVIDTFPYEPKYYYGNVKEILTDENGDIDYYTAELDGGLGTVKCNNAVLYPDVQKIEIGERIRIYANGDVYGDPPRLDALSIIGEDELESAE